MTVQTLPVEQEQVVYAGTTFQRQYRWLYDSYHAQDFSGWDARFLIGPVRGPRVLTLGTDTGGVSLGTDGLITLRLTASQTEALAGQLIYAVDLIDTAGAITRFLRGRLTLVRELEAGP